MMFRIDIREEEIVLKRGINMDMSIVATIGFTVIAAIGIVIIFFASCKKGKPK